MRRYRFCSTSPIHMYCVVSTTWTHSSISLFLYIINSCVCHFIQHNKPYQYYIAICSADLWFEMKDTGKLCLRFSPWCNLYFNKIFIQFLHSPKRKTHFCTMKTKDEGSTSLMLSLITQGYCLYQKVQDNSILWRVLRRVW